MSILYTEVGDNIDIYYLPHSDKESGGIALVDTNEEPGNGRMIFGCIELLISIGLVVCANLLKRRKR